MSSLKVSYTSFLIVKIHCNWWISGSVCSRPLSRDQKSSRAWRQIDAEFLTKLTDVLFIIQSAFSTERSQLNIRSYWYLRFRFTHGQVAVKEFESLIEMILINKFDNSHTELFPFYLTSLLYAFIQRDIQFLWLAELDPKRHKSMAGKESISLSKLLKTIGLAASTWS